MAFNISIVSCLDNSSLPQVFVLSPHRIAGCNHLFFLRLFENKEKAVEKKKEKTIYDIIDSGGQIGWVIVGLGVVALLLVFFHTILLFFADRKTKTITNGVIPLLLADNEKDALALCKRHKGPFARVLEATIRNSHGNRDHMDDVISEALLHEMGPLNRFGPAILVIASISPLLGLLGTVTGMIDTFDIITEFGTGDPKMLSSGIAVALVTTELGLIVAIPSVLAGTLLGSWSDGIKYDLEEIALRATNILLDVEHPHRTQVARPKVGQVGKAALSGVANSLDDFQAS
jgi:biopolymer transport protein ExbB